MTTMTPAGDSMQGVEASVDVSIETEEEDTFHDALQQPESPQLQAAPHAAADLEIQEQTVASHRSGTTTASQPGTEGAVDVLQDLGGDGGGGGGGGGEAGEQGVDEMNSDEDDLEVGINTSEESDQDNYDDQIVEMDMYDSDAEEEQEDSDDDEEELEDLEGRITFDRNLPANHTYLGERESANAGVGGLIPEEDIVRRIPLITLPDLVLFPGQSLPLTLTWRTQVREIKKILEDSSSRRVIAVVNNSRAGFHRDDLHNAIGTTGEIRSFRLEATTLHLLALGRQRVKVVEHGFTQSGLEVIDAQILPESPTLRIPNEVRGCRRFGRHVKIGSAFWSLRFYRMYDCEELMLRAKSLFFNIVGGASKSECPTDPALFSYWLSHNLIATLESRQEMLEADSCVQRLRIQLKILNATSSMGCRRCQTKICDWKQAFCMSTEGPISAYVNPGGVVHETATFFQASSLVLTGSSSTEHSWFPGYAWTIAICACCMRHIGWYFTACNPGTVPRQFWGLSRSSLTPLVRSNEPRFGIGTMAVSEG